MSHVLTSMLVSIKLATMNEINHSFYYQNLSSKKEKRRKNTSKLFINIER